MIAIPHDLDAIDENVIDSFGVGIDPELVPRHVKAVIGRPACHSIPIKHDDIGMIAGRDFLGYARACLTVATVFYFLHALAWIAGSLISLPVPPRYATRGQLITSMVLAFFNFISMFFFKLLPVLGIFTWVMIPFVAPEISMTEYNMERQVPINVLWSGGPWVSFWENFFNLILKFLFYLQPTFGCIFLWTIGTAVRDENIEQSARGLTQSSLGTFFVLICFHLLSLCGASPVIVIVLRVIYGVWFCFLLLFMLSYAKLLMKCREVLEAKINPKNEL